MKSDFYEMISSEDCMVFRFESVSKFKCITKVNTYSPLKKGSDIYNLALFDILANGDYCDLSGSNNLDMDKIIATTVRSMLAFFNRNPGLSIYFSGSTPARTRWYSIIIRKELSEASKIFEIYGLRGNAKELFVLNQKYDAFLITHKNLVQ